MHFSVTLFLNLLAGYAGVLRAALTTSWTAELAAGIGGDNDADTSIQIFHMIRDWHQWKPRSLFDSLLRFVSFFFLLAIGSLCALIALMKTALWAAGLIPAIAISALRALRLTREAAR